MDRETHQRYLDYRERHGYFGSTSKVLTAGEFELLDREHNELSAREATLDDEEHARFEELSKLLFRD
jgi:hypothetical protein